MKWLSGILEELMSLFVDDWRFALAVVAWPAVLWLIVRGLPVIGAFAAPILFIGLAAILAVAALRRATK